MPAPVHPQFQYQDLTEPVQFTPPETITEDKWHQGWSIPVRTKTAAFAVALAASGLFAPVLNPETQIIQGYESRWHQPWSEPVRLKPGLGVSLQQVLASPVVSPAAEVITPDKWLYPWSDPVQQKAGLRAQLQQTQAATTLNPETQIIQTYESRWHYPWSEPVRQRAGLGTHSQQALAAPATTPAAEVITADKWLYPWSEPVRQRPGLGASFQQALSYTTFQPAAPTPGTGLVTPVMDSVGVQFRAQYQYQARAVPIFFVAETITADKWIYPWSEPVRQKAGLGAHLQQAFAATTLNPGTQITQGFESRWHYPWSEPVRLRRFPASEQQAFAFQPPSFEIITTDKWAYPWSEPVRQKPGLRAHLQQVQVATTLNPETQITQTYESRWHYAWSEPVRQKLGLGAHLQQALAPAFIQPAAPTPGTGFVVPVMDSAGVVYPVRHQYQARAFPLFFVAETITADKWLYAWSEPVRQKQGLGAHLQQASIATTLNPETQIIQGFESRWHYPWSEPVRFRRLAVAQYPAITQPPTSVFETVTMDKWAYPLSEPVRQKPGLRASLQQALIATTLNPETQIIQGFESRWHYPWSEPVRLKPGLRAYLQQVQPVPVLNPNTQIIQGFESRWHYAWSEPVRQKPGLRAYLQQPLFFQPSIVPVITGTMFATEQGDLFLAGLSAFNQVGGANVGFIEIVPRSALVGIQVDIPSISANVGALAANPSAQSGTAAPLVYSANVSIRKV